MEKHMGYRDFQGLRLGLLKHVEVAKHDPWVIHNGSIRYLLRDRGDVSQDSVGHCMRLFGRCLKFGTTDSQLGLV